jgi:hypothetical protein
LSERKEFKMDQLKKSSLLCLLALVVSVLAAYIIGVSPVGVQAQVANENPPRSLVMQNAEDYETYSWTPGSNNVGSRSGWAWLACQSQNVWTTIQSDFFSGVPVTGVAYQWGGWDTIDGFQASLNSGELAGDTYDNYHPCPGGGSQKPYFYNATGIDCSGFVTRVWGRTDQKYGCSGLTTISTAISFDEGDYQNDLPRKLRMGDVFNYVTDHVVLLRYFDPDDPLHTPYFYESTWGENQVVRSSGWGRIWPVRNDNTGYRPYRYNNIVDDAYLPDIKANYSGWNSIITVKDNGYNHERPSGAAQITFYDSNGDEVATETKPDLAEDGIWILDASSVVGNNFSGSAVVAAEYDVSVVVQNRHSSMITAYDGIGPTSGTAPDPGFACAADTLHLPLIMRNHDLYGEIWNTTIYIQNASPETAYVYVDFYKQNGSWKDTDLYTIQPGASINLDQVNDGELGSSFIGSARVYSLYQRPVAAIVNEVNTYSDLAMAYNAFSFGAKDVYLPFSFRGWLDLYSDIPVQNIGSSTTVDVYYYEQGGDGEPEWHDSEPIGRRALHIFDPPSGMQGKIAAAVVTSNSSNLIALLHERKEPWIRYMIYNGVAKTASMEMSYVSHVPILYREEYWDSENNRWQLLWLSSIQVQNTEEDIIFITANFFDEAGDEVHWVGDFASANRAVTFYLPAITDLGHNYVGSARVEGHRKIDFPGVNVDRELIAIANVQDFLGGRGGGYNGFNR